MRKHSQPKSTYVCQQCGAKSPRQMARCTVCGAWESMVETRERQASTIASSRTSTTASTELSLVSTEMQPRMVLPFQEVNRVLGGGLVPGSLILVGGDPGIGKSTLLLQAARALAARGRTVLYVAGEESEEQVRMRAQRLGATPEGLRDRKSTRLNSSHV